MIEKMAMGLVDQMAEEKMIDKEAEGLIAIAVIMITGSIKGNIRIYALIAKIIFWMIVRVLA